MKRKARPFMVFLDAYRKDGRAIVEVSMPQVAHITEADQTTVSRWVRLGKLPVLATGVPGYAGNAMLADLDDVLKLAKHPTRAQARWEAMRRTRS